MQPNQEKNPKSKKRQIIFATASILALVAVGTIAYFSLSKIRAHENIEAMSQEQFEAAPTISSQLQGDCQQSAIKINEMTSPDKMEAEFRANVDNCKDVYFLIDHQTQFRREGMYPDLSVDIAFFIAKSDKSRALELLKFARQMKAWEFYLGPVTCDSQHVLDAYIESFTLPDEKVCFKEGDYKEALLKELQNRNFSIFSKMLANDQVVWMGQPDSDVGCPEKISTIIETTKKLTQGAVTFEAAASGEGDSNRLNVVVRSGGEDKLTFIFSQLNGCLQINSILVPDLEATE